MRDLFAHLKTLPAVQGKAKPHDLPFPFNIRRTLGVWKFLFLDGKPFQPDASKDAAWNRGAYLVNGPAIAPSAIRRAICSAASSTASALPAGRSRPATAAAEHHAKELSLSQERSRQAAGDRRDADGDTSAARWPRYVATPAAQRRRLEGHRDLRQSLPPVEGPKSAGAEMRCMTAILAVGEHGSMNLPQGVLAQAHLRAAVRAAFRLRPLCGEAGVPLGQTVFFRALFAIVPVLLICAWQAS